MVQQYYSNNLQRNVDHTGTNGLVVGSACWPTPSTGALDMASFKAWLEKPTFSNDPNATIKNKHVAGAAALAAVVGLVWYGHKNYWF